jgi:hypothetical protein
MRGIAPLKALLVALAQVAALLAFAARADDIEVREAQLTPTEEGIVLDAEFAFDFSQRLAEAVANGVPLYFLVEFELTRPRWYWFDEKAAAKRLQLRLSYHALSRQYRLSTGGLLQQNFATLEEALNVLRRLRGWQVIERGAALADAPHEAAVRMRLDINQLPKPFQLSALTSRDLTLESPWRRFSFRPPPPAPAPVESREPAREAEGK